MLLRNLRNYQTNNDGSRTLFESAMVPEVTAALKDWAFKANNPGIIIGGIALSYYTKPRYTQDVDVLFLKAEDIPVEVVGFKKHRQGAFEHKSTGVEIETVTGNSFKVNPNTIKRVIDTAVTTSGVKVASKEGIIALKLGRASLQDKADIAALLHSGIDEEELLSYPLTDQQLQVFSDLKKEV